MSPPGRLWKFSHIYPKDSPQGDTIYSLFVAIGFAIAILFLRPLDGFINNSKVLMPVTFCGRMCYSLYLVHWLVAVVLGHLLLQAGIHGLVPVLTISAPIIFAVSIGASWAFYMLVERHFLNTANMTAADLAAAAKGEATAVATWWRNRGCVMHASADSKFALAGYPSWPTPV